MSTFKIWLEATRPKTLPAAFCPVMVATALAYKAGHFDWRPASICLLFALLVQIGTNFANDYLDGVKGSDSEARIGPRRAVASGLIAASVMKRAAIYVLTVAFCLGLLLIPFGGWWLLIVGVASVCCAWFYTGGPYPLAYNGLGDVFVIFFFGFMAVGCTYYVQSGNLNAPVLLTGLACGLLINNILVVNNYRDVEEDRVSGKRTLAVCFGRVFAIWQYRLSLLGVDCLFGLLLPGIAVAACPVCFASRGSKFFAVAPLACAGRLSVGFKNFRHCGCRIRPCFFCNACPLAE
ncbi:MAG: 1,4-dihydroxy-2-naphthoate polyprenyltransferase [Opitutales bacterium]